MLHPLSEFHNKWPTINYFVIDFVTFPFEQLYPLTFLLNISSLVFSFRVFYNILIANFTNSIILQVFKSILKFADFNFI